MDAAVRILNEELAWLKAGARRLSADLENPRVALELVVKHLAAIGREVDEVEAALELLTAGQPFQPALPFEPAGVDVDGRDWAVT